MTQGIALRRAVLLALTAACACSTAAASDGLKVGEYACYGSGGRILAGLGFKVLPGGRYTDLDGKEKGSYTVNGDKLSFKGGHMAGTDGRGLGKNRFRVGAQASCEPY